MPFGSHVTTQICFDPAIVAIWIRRIRDLGVELPVYLGMAGAVNRRRLIEISFRVGVGPSVRYVRKYGGLVARLLRREGYRPDDFVDATKRLLSDADLGIAGFHVFTFNQVETTERWRRGMAGIGAIEQTEQVVDEAS